MTDILHDLKLANFHDGGNCYWKSVISKTVENIHGPIQDLCEIEMKSVHISQQPQLWSCKSSERAWTWDKKEKWTCYTPKEKIQKRIMSFKITRKTVGKNCKLYKVFHSAFEEKKVSSRGTKMCKIQTYRTVWNTMIDKIVASLKVKQRRVHTVQESS